VVGVAYSASVAASGGVATYSWSLTSGTLPAGLSLNASTGAITGTPTAPATASLTFTVTDSSKPAQTQSVSLTLTIAPVSVSVSPARAALAITQNLSVTATTNDPGGVNWSATGANCNGSACGSLSAATSLTGVAVTYIAPSAAGLYTVSAATASDATLTASFNVAVTDLAGVTTYHNDLYRDGANTQEYALTPATVTSTTFGKLYSCAVDGAIYAQPLWVPNLTLASTQRNVVFVATQHDSLYAFDADVNASPCAPLWHANLLDAAHGGFSGETSVPSSGGHALVGAGGGDIAPEAGVTGTPVIDLSTNTLYVASKSVLPSGPTFYQRLHAIDLLTGNEKFSAPVTITADYPGTGDGGISTTFLPQQQNQRPALALANGIVYIAWSSHEDNLPYYGWVIGYNAANLSQAYVLNVVPDVCAGGIWMSGAGPAVDAGGNLYLTTGNAIFDANKMSAPNNDYGDSFLKLSSTLNVEQFFTPSDQVTDDVADSDFGSGGPTLIDLPANGANPTHLAVSGAKDGYLYLVNRDDMGKYGTPGALQHLALGNSVFATGAYWNSTYYIAGAGGVLQAFTSNLATAQFNTTPASSSSTGYPFPGATPSVSSQPNNSNGIVWALDNSQYCTAQSKGCGPAVLHAYDAGNLATELWNSSEGSGNAAGYAVKFTVPTVANGKVYVGTRGNNKGGSSTSTSTPGELDIYGLLPN